jgi:hypothetical protein
MSVGNADIEFQTSSNGASIGGTRSGALVSNAKGAFWADIADVDRVAGGSQTKKWFVYNDHGTDALISPSVWVSFEPTYCTEEIGLGFDDTDDDDATTQGNMTAWSANAVAAVLSDGSDTRTVTVYGLDAAGDPVSENIVLNGTSEVVGSQVFSVVYAAKASATDVTNTVTVRQGSGGTTRGTIEPSVISCFLWLNPLVQGDGIRLDDLPAASSYGFWDRITWPASTPGVRPNNSIIAVQEN